MPRTFPLGQKELTYIAHVLSRSGTLGRLAISELALIVRDAVLACDQARQVDDLEAGGFCSKTESLKNLVLFLDKRMKEHSECLLLFNECARLGDPALEHSFQYVTLDSEVYHYAEPHSTQEQIRACIIEAETGIALIGLLVDNKCGSDYLPRQQITEDAIGQCVKAATILIVGVHDGDSYLMCALKKGDI